MHNLILIVSIPLLFAIIWLIFQYSQGNQKIAGRGLKSILFWAIVCVFLIALTIFTAIGATGGHTTDGYDTYAMIVLAFGAIWLYGIIPYLLFISRPGSPKDAA